MSAILNKTFVASRTSRTNPPLLPILRRPITRLLRRCLAHVLALLRVAVPPLARVVVHARLRVAWDGQVRRRDGEGRPWRQSGIGQEGGRLLSRRQARGEQQGQGDQERGVQPPHRSEFFRVHVGKYLTILDSGALFNLDGLNACVFDCLRRRIVWAEAIPVVAHERNVEARQVQIEARSAKSVSTVASLFIVRV